MKCVSVKPQFHFLFHGEITLHRAPVPSSPLLLAFEKIILDVFSEVGIELREQLEAGNRIRF